MGNEPKNRTASSKRSMITAIGIGATVFALDIIAPLGIAGGVLYVVLILYGWNFKNRSVFFILAITTSILTLLGYFLSSEGGISWVVFTNRFYSIVVIWTTALFLWWIRQEQFFVHHKSRQKAGAISKNIFPREGLVVAVVSFLIILSSWGILHLIEASAKADIKKSLTTALEIGRAHV